jgi:hypothetical protein
MIEQQKEWENDKPRKLRPLLEHVRRSKFMALLKTGGHIYDGYAVKCDRHLGRGF